MQGHTKLISLRPNKKKEFYLLAVLPHKSFEQEHAGETG